MEVTSIPIDNDSTLFCYHITESTSIDDTNLKITCGAKNAGGGNLLVIERKNNYKQLFNNCTVNFGGENSLVFIRGSRPNIGISISLNNNSTFYLGKDNFFNAKSHILCTEGKNILIGDKCLFSFGLWFRTADPHLIYDCSSQDRINPSRSILIGDHVWIGQNSLILKGATVGSGSIFGGHSVITGKKFFSNCAYGGNPAKLLKHNVFFNGACVHGYTRDQTEKSMHWEDDDFIYNKTDDHVDQSDAMHSVDEALCDAPTAQKKYEILMEKVVGSKDKYRFVIQEPPQVPKSFFQNCAHLLKDLFRQKSV